MLVARYGDSWTARDDSISTAHLFGVGALIGVIELPVDAYGSILCNLASTQVFHLVRGDVAVLRPGHEKSASWGSIKNQYR